MSENDLSAQRDAAADDIEDVADAVTVPVETNLDEDDRLKHEFVTAVLDAVEQGDAEGARTLVAPLHPADIADLLELTPAEQRGRVSVALGDLVGAEVLSELNDYVRDDVVEAMPNEQIAELAAELDTDDAVAIIEDLDEEDQQEVLEAMEPEDRAAIESALSYAEESAGRLMQRDLVAVPEHWTVGKTIDYLRDTSDLTSDFWEIFVVDATHRPIGTCQLSWVMRCPRDIAMTDVMKREQTLIPVDMDQEEVALRFQKYALISAAVVDEGGRLVGMITVDDIVHIIQEEAGEDILRLSGAGDGDINEPILDSYKARVRWLLSNLVTALVAASIIHYFEGSIEQMAILAALGPIVAGVGGNAGTQTMAVAVRALATNQLTQSNTMRIVMREIRLALLNGVSVAAVIGLGVGLFETPMLGLVIGSAMMANILIAGLAGVLVPVTMDRLDIDPAIASSIFMTMITDSMGYFAFLSLALAFGVVG